MNRRWEWGLLIGLCGLFAACAQLPMGPGRDVLSPGWLEEALENEDDDWLALLDEPEVRPAPDLGADYPVDRLADHRPPGEEGEAPWTVARGARGHGLNIPPPREGEALSRIELLYHRSAGLAGGRALRQFGYDQLQRAEAVVAAEEDEGGSSVPLLDPGGPVDADYLIGPGDEVVLRTTGAVEVDSKLVVQRDGTLFIPEVGVVTVAGVRQRNLNETLREAIERQISPVEVEAALGRLHAIRVLVQGHASRPGLHFLPANSTLIDALSAAGGVARDGSLRRVLVRRAEEDEREVDLYGIFCEGGEVANVRLLSGDLIQIPAIGPTAVALGPVVEGIYELRPGETLSDLAGFAGGLNSFIRKGRIRVEHAEDELKRRICSVDFALQGLVFTLADGDVAHFGSAYGRVDDYVSVEGRVVSPGRHAYEPGMRLSDLLKLGDGFLVDAALERVLLVRQLGIRRSFEVRPGDDSGTLRTELVWVDLPAVVAGDRQADLTLQRLDRLVVFSETEVRDEPVVGVLGAVRQAGRFPLSSGMRVRDLLQLAGGISAEAYDGTSMIVRRNRAEDGRHLDVQLIPFDLNGALAGSEGANLPLHNQDQVVIRRVQALQVRVEIQGRVHFPGTYILPDGSSISDLLVAAGGLLPGGDLRAARFSRESVRRRQQEQLSDMMRRNSEYFARIRDQVTRDGYYNESAANQMALVGLGQLDRNARTVQATGRIVLDLTQEDFPETVDDLELEDGDRLLVPRRRNTIAVLGRVFNPNSFICRTDEGLRVGDYLEMAGGLQHDADKKQFYLLLASGEVRSAAQYGRRRLLRHQPRPGDAVLVPQEPLKRSTKSSISDTLMIMRQMAELGLVGAALPQVEGPVLPAVGIESSTVQQNNPVGGEDSYQPIIDDPTGGKR